MSNVRIRDPTGNEAAPCNDRTCAANLAIAPFSGRARARERVCGRAVVSSPTRPGDRAPSMARPPPLVYAARPMTARAVGLVCASFVAAMLGVGCAPEIGDDCTTSADCSVNGDRVCDVSQPSGYCTIQGCDGDTCPDEGVCVEWRGDPERTRETWCMATCSDDGDCREDDGYKCVGMDGIADGIAVVLDGNSSRKFCVAFPAGP